MKQIEQKFETGMMVPWAKPRGAMIRRGKHKGSDELLTPALAKEDRRSLPGGAEAAGLRFSVR